MSVCRYSLNYTPVDDGYFWPKTFQAEDLKFLEVGQLIQPVVLPLSNVHCLQVWPWNSMFPKMDSTMAEVQRHYLEILLLLKA